MLLQCERTCEKMHEALSWSVIVRIFAAVSIFFLAGCDRDSAVDSGEYLTDRGRLASSEIRRISVYLLPNAAKNKQWAEAALIRKGFPSKSFFGGRSLFR